MDGYGSENTPPETDRAHEPQPTYTLRYGKEVCFCSHCQTAVMTKDIISTECPNRECGITWSQIKTYGNDWLNVPLCLSEHTTIVSDNTVANKNTARGRMAVGRFMEIVSVDSKYL